MILPEMKNKYFNFSSFNNSPSAKNHLNSVQPETQYHETIQQKGKKKEGKKERKEKNKGWNWSSNARLKPFRKENWGGERERRERW